MRSVERGDDRRAAPAAPWSPADQEPEPEWAKAIRQGRKARGDRLRRVFETFTDADRSSVASASPREVGSPEGEAP